MCWKQVYWNQHFHRRLSEEEAVTWEEVEGAGDSAGVGEPCHYLARRRPCFLHSAPAEDLSENDSFIFLCKGLEYT